MTSTIPQIEDRLRRYPPDRSHTAAVAVKVRFYNFCQYPINIWWLNYQGVKVQYYSNVNIVPGYRCDMEMTYLTHPWVFTRDTGEPLYAQYSTDRRTHFEVLRFVYDQLKNGKIGGEEFRRKVRGEEYVDVAIIGPGSLTEMSTYVIARLLVTKYRQDESNLVSEAVEEFNLPVRLGKEVINTYRVIRKLHS